MSNLDIKNLMGQRRVTWTDEFGLLASRPKNYSVSGNEGSGR